MARRFPINLPDDELRIYLQQLDADVAGYVEETLVADLASGDTVTLNGHTLNGKFIRAGFSLPATSIVGAIWNGTDYSIIVANKCEQ